MTTEHIVGAGGEILRPYKNEGNLVPKKMPARSLSSEQDRAEISKAARNLQNAASVSDSGVLEKDRMEAIVRRIEEEYYSRREVIEAVADALIQSMWDIDG